MAEKTEADFIEEMRPHLEAIIGVLDEAARQKITLTFSIGIDPATGKSSITALAATKSFL